MSAESEELYSLLIPLAEERLIVPRACVAEVVRFTKPETGEGSRDWMMGTVNWNGRMLPVVSFEGALGKEKPAATGRTRIVVFYASTGPRILNLEYDPGTNRVWVQTSPVAWIDFVGAVWLARRVTAPAGQMLTEAEFHPRSGQRYLRIACCDPRGNWAWSNPITFDPR